MRQALPLLLLSFGCSEYDFHGTAKPTVEGHDEAVDLGDDPEGRDRPNRDDTADPIDDPWDASADCTGVDFGIWQWWGSQPFTHRADPTDSSGRDFFDPAYDMRDYSTVALPARNIPTGHDKAYLADFDLAALPPNMTLDLQSDDGISLWVNGDYVGHWGGDWQQEGCVNEDADCEITVDVPSIDVTDLLQVGGNTIAARVSNPVAGSWYELKVRCLE